MRHLKSVWLSIPLTLTMTGQLAASIPKTEDEIRAMLKARAPEKKPPHVLAWSEEDDEPIPMAPKELEELATTLAEHLDRDEKESLPGGLGFLKYNGSLVFEGRSVRAHLKDAAQQLAEYMKEEVKQFRSKWVNRCYVKEQLIPLDILEPTGTIVRYIQVDHGLAA